MPLTLLLCHGCFEVESTIAVNVEMLIPADDLSEPCYELETVEFLRAIQEDVERGGLAWVTSRDESYTAMEIVRAPQLEILLSRRITAFPEFV